MRKTHQLYIVFVGLLFSTCDVRKDLLICPADNRIISKVTPLFAWRAQKADSIEVWIDGVKMSKLDGNARSYHPFPMAYGHHSWHIKAYSDTLAWQSETNHFEIKDGPLAAIPEDAI